jgi:hypothetical protein
VRNCTSLFRLAFTRFVQVDQTNRSALITCCCLIFPLIHSPKQKLDVKANKRTKEKVKKLDVKADEMTEENVTLTPLREGLQSVAQVVNGESLESLLDLPLPVLRERLGCPNTHKSKAYLVTQLAKKLGILPRNIAELAAEEAPRSTTKVAGGTEATVLELLTGRQLSQKRARPPTQPREGPVVVPSFPPPKRTKSKPKGVSMNQTHQAILPIAAAVSANSVVAGAAASMESAAPAAAAEPKLSTSDGYLQFLRKELVGVDVRLKTDHAHVGKVIGVADGGAQGVALKVQSGEAVVEFPASSLEAAPTHKKAPS